MPLPYQEHTRHLAEHNAGVHSLFEEARALAEGSTFFSFLPCQWTTCPSVMHLYRRLLP